MKRSTDPCPSSFHQLQSFFGNVFFIVYILTIYHTVIFKLFGYAANESELIPQPQKLKSGETYGSYEKNFMSMNLAKSNVSFSVSKTLPRSPRRGTFSEERYAEISFSSIMYYSSGRLKQ